MKNSRSDDRVFVNELRNTWCKMYMLCFSILLTHQVRTTKDQNINPKCLDVDNSIWWQDLFFSFFDFLIWFLHRQCGRKCSISIRVVKARLKKKISSIVTWGIVFINITRPNIRSCSKSFLLWLLSSKKVEKKSSTRIRKQTT